jgi:hypothetical protein
MNDAEFANAVAVFYAGQRTPSSVDITAVKKALAATARAGAKETK